MKEDLLDGSFVSETNSNGNKLSSGWTYRSTEDRIKSLYISDNSKDFEVGLEIPESVWFAGELAKGSFRPASDLMGLSPMELSLLFIEHILNVKFPEQMSKDGAKLLNCLFVSFCETYLNTTGDPHRIFPMKLQVLSLNLALKVYYSAACKLNMTNDLARPISALKVDGVKLMGVFSGQASSEDLLGELHVILNTYGNLVHGLFVHLAAVIKKQSEDKLARDTFLNGFDLVKWLDGPKESWPSREYILAAPRSFPLVGVVQLLNFYLLVKLYDVQPENLIKTFSSCTGHSQGIMSAAMLALVKDEKDFFKGAEDVIKALFWTGLRCQQAVPVVSVHPDIIADAEEHGEGEPSPMLSISGMPRTLLEKLIKETNARVSSEVKLEIGLKNGPSSFVVCGPVLSLYSLVLCLRPLQAGQEDQSRIPYGNRKLQLKMRFLPISVPFHSQPMKEAVPLILSDIKRVGCDFFLKPVESNFPVTHLATGEEFCAAGKRIDLIQSLIEQTCYLPVDWPKASRHSGITHMLEFGPGGVSSGTLRNLEGTGTQIALAGTVEPIPGVLSKGDLFHKLYPKWSWKEQFAPKLKRVNGQVFVDTSFSRLLGKPPVMVAGMTPCTVAEPFVSAVIQAGYHVELSGGGHFNEEVLRAKIDAIITKVGPGCSITLNSLFLNPRLWAIQYPVVKQMRAEGYPIEGFCIAAGVPSFDAAKEIVDSLKEAGIRHVSFKPGSTQAILEVVRIAKACPTMPVILQWTGGRAGGHHSFEDFHAPILETYASMRSASNIILVAGSGFGDGPGSLPYLTGDWSLAFEHPAMPFDGILIGSRVMVAAENQASLAVKELIVAAPGVTNEADWVKTYNEPVGGVITVRSELGEPIHKIATRGVLFWKYLDDNIFNLPPGEKRLAAIKAKQSEIISRLNSDHQKVWFGRKLDGTICDLSEMTYYEVARRVGELLYVWHQRRWIDITFKAMLELYLRRVEERFLAQDKAQSKLPEYPEWFTVEGKSFEELDPYAVIEPFFAHYPLAKDTVISSEDIQAFLIILQIPWHKPAPFVPTLEDDRLEYWLKKDSLWQSEDVDAVVGQDAQRVAILHGPVAARYATKVNEPVKEILDGIHNYYIEELERTTEPEDVEWFGGAGIKYPTELDKNCCTESLSIDEVPSAAKLTDDCCTETTSIGGVPTLIISQPAGGVTTCDWLEILAGPQKSWLRALLRSSTILQGARSVVPNRVRTFFKPRPGVFARRTLEMEGGSPVALTLLDSEGKVLIETTLDPATNLIKVVIQYLVRDDDSDRYVPLELLFKYCPNQPNYLIHEVMESRIERVRRFYWSVWYGSGKEAEFEATRNLDPLSTILESELIIDEERCQRFCRIVGNHSTLYQKGNAPMDYAMVACWEPVMRLLFLDAVQGDILQLVHLSNKIEHFSDDQQQGLVLGDNVKVKARLVQITQGPTGKTVAVEADIYSAQDGSKVLRVTSSFFFREGLDRLPAAVLFERRRIEETVLSFKGPVALELFLQKRWLHMEGSYALNQDKPLRVRDSESLTIFTSDGGIKQIKICGAVGVIGDGMRWVQLGKISFEGHDLAADPVTAYLLRAGKTAREVKPLVNGGNDLAKQTIIAPADNQVYSTCSGDHNPIHTSAAIAEYAGLPGTITHGLWSSAAVRSLLETAVEEDSRAESVVRYNVNFTGMVLPGEALSVQLEHVGMRDGLKMIRFEVRNGDDVIVLQGDAEARQATTAYVFTGQGSQEQGMGMDLYASSPVAKAIWDRAEKHFLGNYGFSILEIVRKNPKTLTVYFGGPRGAEIREAYMALTYVTATESIKLFPEIGPETSSYTFNSPAGLLAMTQFTQPAITLMELAAFETMRSQGLVDSSASFAGHSLGEYAALASVARVMEVEMLGEVVFYRGMCMQKAVKRDAEGRSPYGMAAVNPSRLGSAFGQAQLQTLVAEIGKQTKLLLEIVNYNVKNWQYVVAGDLRAIEALTGLLNRIAKGAKADTALIAEVFGKVPDGLQKLSRGQATIPLAGIDVPFHSSFLLGGVQAFRTFLMARFEQVNLEPSALIGRYIPNLIAEPFGLDRSYIEKVLAVSKSPVLEELLKSWKTGETERLIAEDPTEARRVANILLCELLSYQFASPVRWIETQDLLFSLRGKAILRFVEIGPAPVLCGMADRTLGLDKSLVSDARRSRIRLLSDKDSIYYNVRKTPDAGEEATATVEEPKETTPTVPSAPLIQTEPVLRATQTIDDVPIKAAELVQILVAQKTRKTGSDLVPPSKTIKEIAGGKSTLQNELVGELGKEFGAAALSGIDKPEELSMAEIGAQIERVPGWSRAPGKVVNGLVSKMLSSKMPSGFSASSIKSMLQTEFGLSSKSSDILLAIAYQH